MKGTWGTETSNYPEEKKVKTIPKVVASEIGRGQTIGRNTKGVGTEISMRSCSRTCLERQTKDGDSPVDETTKQCSESRVSVGTWNPQRTRGDHPPSLNTTW